MTIPPIGNERGAAWRGIVAALTAAILLSVAGYAAMAATATATMRLARPGALLGDLRSRQAANLAMLSDVTVRRAIAAEPLDGRLVNIAMARDVQRHGEGRMSEWLKTIAQLGWRDTPSLQNRLYAAAKNGDISRALDIGDALLRRQQLVDQVIPVLSLMEDDAALRKELINRLKGNPKWRLLYLSATGHLQQRQQLLARYALLTELLARHAGLEDSEVMPSILALDQASMPQYGFALWKRIRPAATQPLDDMSFDLASRNDRPGQTQVPYQWQIMTGEGFNAEALRDDKGTRLSIDWSGRGVPVFAQQRTSARPGMYALDLDVSPEERADLPALTFGLVCGDTIISFEQIGRDPRYLRTRTAVPCAYPTLQIAGDIQSSVAAHDVTINHIALHSLDIATRGR